MNDRYKRDAKASDKKKLRTDSGSVSNRTPPFSLEAEENLLGALLLDPMQCDVAAEFLAPADFYDPLLGTIYGTMLALIEGGKRFDVPLLVERLRQQNDLERIGGMATLARLADVVSHAVFARDYAECIKEHAAKRRLIEACSESLVEAYESDEPAATILDRAENRVFSIAETQARNSVKELKDILNDAMNRLDARLSGAEHDAIDSGFVDLDHMLAGMHRGELLILAARPSMGKTALALNIAEHVAIDAKQPVFFVSLEMAAVELSNRLLCSRARLDGNLLRRGILSSSDKRRMIDVVSKIEKRPIYVDDSPSRTVMQIAAAARRVQRAGKKRLALIVIDYLQLIEPDNPRDPRQEQVARIARRLKNLARDLEVPVLCLAQLNRQAEVSKDNRPKLSHLRESGAIEQDADVVMFIHREEYYLTGDERKEHEGQAQIIVAKQRNGPVGDVEVHFHSKFARFDNAETRGRSPDYGAFGGDGSSDPGGDPF